jgi:hypothetical protein
MYLYSPKLFVFLYLSTHRKYHSFSVRVLIFINKEKGIIIIFILKMVIFGVMLVLFDLFAKSN